MRLFNFIIVMIILNFMNNSYAMENNIKIVLKLYDSTTLMDKEPSEQDDLSTRYYINIENNHFTIRHEIFGIDYEYNLTDKDIMQLKDLVLQVKKFGVFNCDYSFLFGGWGYLVFIDGEMSSRFLRSEKSDKAQVHKDLVDYLFLLSNKSMNIKKEKFNIEPLYLPIHW